MPMSPRLLRPRAAGGFNPRSLSGLAAWFDASVSSSITIQTGVSRWNDLSGNSRHLTQNTTNNQPAYGNVTLNGRSVVTFDGSNDRLQSAAFSIPQPYSVWGVMRTEITPASTVAMFAMGVTPSAPSGDLYRNATGGAAWYLGSAFRTQSGYTNALWNAFNVHEAIASDPSLSLARVYGKTSGTPGPAGTNGASLITLGAVSSGSSPSNCSFAEFIFFSRVLEASEAAMLSAYLQTKWQLT